MTDLFNLRAEIVGDATAPTSSVYHVENFLSRQKECLDLFDTWCMAYGDDQAHVMFDSQAVIIQNLAAMRAIVQAVKDRRGQVKRAREAAEKNRGRASTAVEAGPARADRPRGNTASSGSLIGYSCFEDNGGMASGIWRIVKIVKENTVRHLREYRFGIWLWHMTCRTNPGRQL
jgi:hypothetical protein